VYGLAGALVVVVVIIVAAMFAPEDEVAPTAAPQDVVTTAAVAATPETVTPEAATATTATPTTAAEVAAGTFVEPEFASPPTKAEFTATPMTIDSFEDEWTTELYWESEHEVFGADTIDDVADLSATWRVAWDRDFLYFYARVDDDVVAQVNTGADLFKGDAVAFYFDNDPSNDTPGGQLGDDNVAFFFAPELGGQNWVRLIPTPNGGGFGADGAVTFDPELQVSADILVDVYEVEARVPWRLLGVTDPQPGQRFRMTLDVSDNDTPGVSQQEAMISNSVNRTVEGQAFPLAWEELILES
jgi:hypothetical protein